MNAIVLAKGKKSNRLKLDKAFLEIEGKTVIEQLLEKIEDLFDKIYLVSIHPEIETEYVSGKELERFGDPEVVFFNLNTRKDLEEAKSLWKKYC